MSLAGILNIDLENVPAEVPYLSIPKEIVVPSLPGNGKRKVGLVWAGSTTHASDHHRSCPLEQIMKLANSADIDFYSLQLPINKNDRSTLSEHDVVDLEPELHSYAHTGGLLKQLDLVIGVDTSVIHLAAALAIPTWVLLAAHSDWRWLEQRDDSPWYPRVTLFRQSVPDDWSELIDRVRHALS